MKRAFVFFPHNVFPPRTGAHRRCREILGGLQELGWDVSLASSYFSTDTPWEKSSESPRALDGIPRVYIHRWNIWDYRYILAVKRLYRILRLEPPLDSSIHSPPNLRRWYSRVFEREAPDALMMSYAHWSGLVSRSLHNRTHTLIDTIDLVSVSYARKRALERDLVGPPPYDPKRQNSIVLEENYFSLLNHKPDPREFRIYDRFDDTIAITPSEARAIRQRTHRTRVSTIPMTQEAASSDNSYSGGALFTSGLNLFNVQGYCYFVERVLPLVRSQLPSFELTIIGGVCDAIREVEGVRLYGFVPDLSSCYASARMAISPILAKTGQQTKITEAMAHGLPVVATAASADGTPLEHGVNGYIASNAAEFAEYVVELWRDPKRCRELGTAARECIANQYSRAQWLAKLNAVLSRSGGTHVADAG